MSTGKTEKNLTMKSDRFWCPNVFKLEAVPAFGHLNMAGMGVSGA